MKRIQQELKLDSENVSFIIKIIREHGGKARLVGGAVRDALISKKNTDIDLITDFTPERIINLFAQHHIRTIPTGIKYGTVTLLIRGESFEITTLRKDISSDGRFAKVRYTNDFKEDAARRDFTINALSYCPIKHHIYDYFNGIDDLQARKVVFIGPAVNRIQEDYLRILRFFRFSCSFADKIDQQSLEACTQLKSGLKLLSYERIKWEMDRLLVLSNSHKILSIMFESRILAEIFPVQSFDIFLWENAFKISNVFKEDISLETKYALLFAHNCNLSRQDLIQLKFSRSEINIILPLLNLNLKLSQDKIIFILKKHWLESNNYKQYFIFAAIIYEEYISSINELYTKLEVKNNKPIFPMTGKEIENLGFFGKNIGLKFNLAYDKWIESNFTLNKNDLINIIKL